MTHMRPWGIPLQIATLLHLPNLPFQLAKSYKTPFVLQHQSITRTLLLCRLLMVRIFPIAAYQAKNTTLGGTFGF
jgi:hypothetical protein